jgi:hypothetical protein
MKWEDILFRSGDVFLPASVRKVLEHYYIGNDRSLVYFTNWSIIHFLSGVLLGYILITYYPNLDYYWTGFYWHTVWEVWQLFVRNTPRTPRGFIDICVDTSMTMLGMLFYRQLQGLR